MRLPSMIRPAVLPAAFLALLVPGCGNTAAAPDAGPSAAKQEMVFMWSPTGDPAPIGPDTPYEVALLNLDGGGFQQLTRDGTQKFLPHLSPDSTKVLYTKFIAGGYGSGDAVTEVAMLDLATGKETLLTSGGDNGYGVWSPDGGRIAYLDAARLGQSTTQATTLRTIGVDGGSAETAGSASGGADDLLWGDIAWSSDDWILFVVGEEVDGGFCKSRIDKIRPDGSSRTQVTNGGDACTPAGKEAVGDADPGWSSDGKTIFSSRGLPVSPDGAAASANITERKLFSFSSDAWTVGKPEADLSWPPEPGCVEGVPKDSPDGARVLLFRVCFDNGAASAPGIYLTDTAGSLRTFIARGFGPDWNPLGSAQARKPF